MKELFPTGHSVDEVGNRSWGEPDQEKRGRIGKKGHHENFTLCNDLGANNLMGENVFVQGVTKGQKTKKKNGRGKKDQKERIEIQPNLEDQDRDPSIREKKKRSKMKRKRQGGSRSFQFGEREQKKTKRDRTRV